MQITFEQVKNTKEIQTYIEKSDEILTAMGYTEHSFAHVNKCAKIAADLLNDMGYDARTVELARIAAYMHDIGNLLNRFDHAQSGAVMAFTLLHKMRMPPEEIATIVSAIGHHDEGTAFPVNAVAAALILADKSDVRRTRVRNNDPAGFDFDIHDRVNYAVEKSALNLKKTQREISLDLIIDTAICPVLDYFEIFLGRMMLCRRAANFFNLNFKLVINGASLL